MLPTLRLLSPPQRDALRAALASLLERYFAYPTYFDYRRNRLARRPLDASKRLEIIRHLQQTSLDLDIPLDSQAMEHWTAQTLLAFANSNPALATVRASPRRHALVRRARLVATEIARFAQTGLLHDPPAAYAAEAPQQWLGAQHNRSRLDHMEQYERQTQMLALVLARRADRMQSAGLDALEGAGSRRDFPSPLGAAGGAPPDNARGGLFGFGRKRDQAQPDRERRAPARPREATPDLLQLYGEYLSDMQPEMLTHETAAIPRLSATLTGATAAHERAASGQSDVQLFFQLRFQIETYVRRAARNYGLPDLAGDPAHAIEALRGSNMVDESDLRIAEGIFALTDRVIAAGAASIVDHRQALMLYLLYHRSHLG
jgi:hypothetical protein